MTLPVHPAKPRRMLLILILLTLLPCPSRSEAAVPAAKEPPSTAPVEINEADDKSTQEVIIGPEVTPPPKGIPESRSTTLRTSQITALRNRILGETTSQTLENFFHDDGFMMNEIMGRERAALPLQPSTGYPTVLGITRNERFGKLFAELGQLPKDRAAALVNGELETLLKLYGPLHDAKFKEAQKSEGALELTQDGSPNPKPTVVGCRKAILGLILIAGNLELKETHATIVKIAELASRDRDRLYPMEDREMLDEVRGRFLLEVSLYNRQSLITGLLGTSQGVHNSGEIQAKYQLRLTTTGLMRPGQSRGYNGGVGGSENSTIRFVFSVSDDQFDTLRRMLAN